MLLLVLIGRESNSCVDILLQLAYLQSSLDKLNEAMKLAKVT